MLIIIHAMVATLCSTALRLTANFSNPIRLFLPVQFSAQKYFPSRFAQIKSISIPVPSHSEGRFAIVTNVGLRDAVDAAVPRRRKIQPADGEVVWAIFCKLVKGAESNKTL